MHIRTVRLCVVAALSLAGPAFGGESEAALSTAPTAAPQPQRVLDIGAGYPDGEGHALYWVQFPDGSFNLLEIPGGGILLEADGFNHVFWIPGGTAVGEVYATGAQRTVRPFLRRGSLISTVGGAKVQARFYRLQWQKDGTFQASELPRALWPVTKEQGGRLVTFVPDLPETRRRGSLELLFGEATSPEGEVKQFIQIRNRASGEEKFIYLTAAAPPRLSSPLFVDDDTVVFTLGTEVWQVKISGGEAERLFPAPVKEEPAGSEGEAGGNTSSNE